MSVLTDCVRCMLCWFLPECGGNLFCFMCCWIGVLLNSGGKTGGKFYFSSYFIEVFCILECRDILFRIFIIMLEKDNE